MYHIMLMIPVIFTCHNDTMNLILNGYLYVILIITIMSFVLAYMWTYVFDNLWLGGQNRIQINPIEFQIVLINEKVIRM